MTLPLVTLQGLAPETLRRRIDGRRVAIWGTGPLARDVHTSLTKSGIPVSTFLHDRACGTFLDLPLCAPAQALPEKPFVIVAAASYRRAALDISARYDLERGRDVLTHLDIARPHAIVEIAARNTPAPFHPIARDHAPAFMDVATFTRIVEKLAAEIPLLTRIGLSLFGDPETHPDYAAIKSIAERIAPLAEPPGQEPYLMPYDYMLEYAQGETIAAPVRAALQNLPWNVEKALQLARSDHRLPCLSQRVFPVIRTDGAVVLCHLYDGPVVAENYLETPWARILQNRHEASHCARCQDQGLHRLDLDVLRMRHDIDL
ncbi:MAG: hypothetical protein H6865_04245 [Rhodospirillales bacterium]|nr:hypothetical protein [Alphaproteobacteria bacterium]MCB9986828.1 hypothetical protein [Rhodospirillales bacterium]USO08408.1 MAG: hypothetical protein H6866_04135 [Rhodospirillales bacterium]